MMQQTKGEKMLAAIESGFWRAKVVNFDLTDCVRPPTWAWIRGFESVTSADIYAEWIAKYINLDYPNYCAEPVKAAFSDVGESNRWKQAADKRGGIVWVPSLKVAFDDSQGDLIVNEGLLVTAANHAPLALVMNCISLEMEDTFTEKYTFKFSH